MSEGLLQRHEQLVNLVEEVRALLDRNTKDAAGQAALDRRRIENLESVVGVSEVVGAEERARVEQIAAWEEKHRDCCRETTTSDPNATHPFGSDAAGGEFMRRLVLVQSGMEELRQQIYELRGEVIKATGNAVPEHYILQTKWTAEIPKRQNPPPRVRKAAKMATPKRKR